MESSGEWIRAAKSCPSPSVDMGFLQQYVQGLAATASCELSLHTRSVIDSVSRQDFFCCLVTEIIVNTCSSANDE